MSASAGRRERRRIDPAFAWKFAYFAGNAVFISVLYSIRSTALYTADGERRDAAVEAWLWIVLLSSWACYLLLQGSDPGYIVPGAERLPPAPPLPASAEAAGSGAATAHGADSGEVTVTIGGRASSGDGAGGIGAASSASTGGEDGGRGAVAAGGAPSAFAGEAAFAGGDRPVGPSSGLRSDAGASAAMLFGSRDQAGVDLIASAMDADADYDPEHAADPMAAKAQALAAAQRGERHCRFCDARQPARAHHCRQCNKCVHTFDHHCMWIGTCIGERNRCRFWWFLLTQSTALAYVIGLLNTGFVYRRTSGEWAEANILSLLAVIVLWMLQLFVFGLLVFHSWLATTNATSFEMRVGVKRLWYLEGTNPRECDIPYSNGLCGNLRLFCCRLDAGVAGRATCRRRQRVDYASGDGGGAASGGAARDGWMPMRWTYPGTWDRNSDDVWNNLWENQYWSCC